MNLSLIDKTLNFITGTLEFLLGNAVPIAVIICCIGFLYYVFRWAMKRRKKVKKINQFYDYKLTGGK